MEIDINVKGKGTEGTTSSSGSGTTAVLGMSKKLLGVLGAIAGSTAILAKASPAFMGSFKVLEKAFILTFKPLGDLIGRLLRPVLILLLRWVYEQLKMSKKNLTEGEKGIKEGLAKIGDALKTGDSALGQAGVAEAGMGMLQWFLGFLESIPILGLVAVLGEKIGTWIAENIINPLLNLFDTVNKILLGVASKIGVWIYDNVIKPFLALVLAINKKFFEYIGQVGTWVYNYVISPIMTTLTNIYLKIRSYWDLVKIWVYTNIISPIMVFLLTIYTKLKSYWDAVKTWIETYITTPIVTFFDAIKQELTGEKGILSKVNGWISKYISNPIKSLLSWIKSKIAGAKSGDDGSSSSVQDAIITPKGDIIRTNPADYLIATKNPKGLMGSGGPTISTMNVNITVQELNSDMQIRQLAQKVSESIQRQMSYRTAGGY